jgi:AraC family transcriptional regulator
MRPSPIPFSGQTLCERQAPGLRVVVGFYAPCAQALHVHEHASFSVLVAGKGVDRCRTRTYEQPPLSAVFHPTRALHANDVGPDGVLGLTLELEPAWLHARALTEKTLGGYRAVAPAARSRLACLTLLGAAWRGGARTAADIETHALELIELLLHPTDPHPGGPAPPWLARGEEFLRAHFRSPIGLSQAAREAGVHPIHFARVFRRHHGHPVSAHIRALRLSAAGELIVGGSHPLAQVACRTGFADQAHLTRWFARVIGLSPGTLRRLGQSVAPGGWPRSVQPGAADRVPQPDRCRSLD